MTAEPDRSTILAALAAIAPEADVGTLAGDADIRDALDLDSMDVLHFATALHERFGVEVPESDYAQIVGVDGCLRYLQQHHHQLRLLATKLLFLGRKAVQRVKAPCLWRRARVPFVRSVLLARGEPPHRAREGLAHQRAQHVTRGVAWRLALDREGERPFSRLELEGDAVVAPRIMVLQPTTDVDVTALDTLTIGPERLDTRDDGVA